MELVILISVFLQAKYSSLILPIVQYYHVISQHESDNAESQGKIFPSQRQLKKPNNLKLAEKYAGHGLKIS